MTKTLTETWTTGARTASSPVTPATPAGGRVAAHDRAAVARSWTPRRGRIGRRTVDLPASGTQGHNVVSRRRGSRRD